MFLLYECLLLPHPAGLQLLENFIICKVFYLRCCLYGPNRLEIALGLSLGCVGCCKVDQPDFHSIRPLKTTFLEAKHLQMMTMFNTKAYC
ncbi:hypothetical protein AVEN_137031-1 [Araneus ventricosus]|uniref:Uncharacterized protein n=1 Tax=Araneus ventricosus TaxID=182803 RepID=A0A4Y2PAK0_ARAVE|nr:hypothetical protein AVEN_137031-1 [Araneus ventricosus]